jgi:hypothetical protein
VSVGRDRAGGRVDDAADDADQRRLAGPVGAEEREDLAAPDLQIDILERLEAGGVGLREIRDRDDGLHESAKHERGRLVSGA